MSTVVHLNGLFPGGLAIHKDGRLFIAALTGTFDSGAILAVNLDGSGLQTIIPVVAGYAPNDLVFDAAGGFYFVGPEQPVSPPDTQCLTPGTTLQKLQDLRS